MAGKPFEMERHIERLERSAAALRLKLDPSAEEISQIAEDLLRREAADEAQIYIQVTRGVGAARPRHPGSVEADHVGRDPTGPAPAPDLLKNGGAAITVPDDRWARCDVKVIGLTANVLARTRPSTPARTRRSSSATATSPMRPPATSSPSSARR